MYPFKDQTYKTNNTNKRSIFLVFIGIIGGIKLFGILGIIYGPLIITIFLTLAAIYRLEYKV